MTWEQLSLGVNEFFFLSQTPVTTVRILHIADMNVNGRLSGRRSRSADEALVFQVPPQIQLSTGSTLVPYGSQTG